MVSLAGSIKSRIYTFLLIMHGSDKIRSNILIGIGSIGAVSDGTNAS